MPIKQPLGDMPREGDPADNAPVPHPRYVTKLADAWYQLYQDTGGGWAHDDDRWRASLSGMCAREVSYEIRRRDAELAVIEASIESPVEDLAKLEAAIAEAKATNPPTVADAWRFGIGTMVHEGLQDAVRKAWPGAGVEVICDFRTDGVTGGGHADIVVDEYIEVSEGVAVTKNPYRTLIELKTINGFGFKTAATTFKGWPEGPRSSAVLQGAVDAHALHADRLVIGYLALELLSPDVARRNSVDEVGRFAAEWWYGPEQFEPLARSELKRVGDIFDLVDNHNKVPRQIPDLPPGARIVDPSRGTWTVEEGGVVVDTNKTWHCGYCRDRDRCIGDGA